MTKATATPESVIIIPALDEGETISWVVEQASELAPDFDVLVIDDGSRDDTASKASSGGALVVSHPFNLGYGAALQTGYKWAYLRGYSYLVQMDADGQHDPKDAPSLVAALRADKADVVVGSRFLSPTGYEMGFTRTVGRLFFHQLLLLLGGPLVTDPTSGLQALSRTAFSYCCRDFYPTDFPDVDVLLLLHRRGFRVLEIPVQMHPSRSTRVPMHAGMQAIYYTYKMLLSTFRSAVTPDRRPPAGQAGSEDAAERKEEDETC